MTLREQLVDALKTLGFVEVKSKSKKYVAMQSPNGQGSIYFVGKCGALRCGKNSSSSISIDAQKVLCLAARKRGAGIVPEHV
jgi:hypothetical protein